MEKAKDILKGHNATVEGLELPDDFSKILEWHRDILSAEGRSSFLGQYLTDKSLLHEDIVGHVENTKNVSHKQQLEAYDNCARLRPIWDDLASKYDVILTPSVVDEAPVGSNTGDMVSPSCEVYLWYFADFQVVFLLAVDGNPRSGTEHSWFCWREWFADRFDSCGPSIHG